MQAFPSPCSLIHETCILLTRNIFFFFFDHVQQPTQSVTLRNNFCNFRWTFEHCLITWTCLLLLCRLTYLQNLSIIQSINMIYQPHLAITLQSSPKPCNTTLQHPPNLFFSSITRMQSLHPTLLIHQLLYISYKTTTFFVNKNTKFLSSSFPSRLANHSIFNFLRNLINFCCDLTPTNLACSHAQ